MSATIGQQLLTYFAGPTLSTLTSHAAEIPRALDALQHTTHSAEQTAEQIREVLSNPGGGLSGQPTIPRGEFTRKLAAFYARVFPNHHVLVVYDRAAKLLSLKHVLGGNGRYVAGPTEMYTCHKKVHRGKARIGLWGFHVIAPTPPLGARREADRRSAGSSKRESLSCSATEGIHSPAPPIAPYKRARPG